MLDKLSIFGYRAMWSPGFLLVTILLGLLYLIIVNKYKGSENVKISQMVIFFSALVSLYIIKGSPVDLLGHLNFSVHMIQMSILYLVLPPLFILGTPKWIFRKIFSTKPLEKALFLFTKPIFSLLMFNGLFSFYHFPFIFDIVKTSPTLHAITTVAIFISALFMWWPLVCPLEEYRKLSGLQKIAYIFADGVLLTPACALIIFADVPLFATYYDPAVWAKALELCVPASMLTTIDLSSPQMFSWLPPRDDQQLGGVIMKLMQELAYGTTLAYVFFQWVKEEKKKETEQRLVV